MKKKLLAMVMSACMLTGMVASTPVMAAEEEHEPVTVTMWWPGSGEGYENLAAGMAEMVHEKYDWITVEYLTIPWGDYDAKMNVAFAGGTAPDIFGVGMNPLPNYVQTGNLLELEESLGDDWDGWSDIPQNVIDCATFDGHFYGVMMCDIRPLIYRTDMFEAAGLDTENPPSNKEELWDAAVKLTQYDEEGKVVVAGFQVQTSGYVDQTLFASALMHGQDHFWDEDFNLEMTTPEMLEAVEYCKRFISEGLCDFSSNIGTSSFAEGTSAMTLNTSCNELGNIAATIGLDKIAVATPPTENGTNFLGGTVVCVNNQAKNMDAVMLAYEVMTGTEGCALAGISAGFCPPRESSWDEYVAVDPDIYGPCVECLESAKTYGPLNPYFADFRNEAILPYLEQIYYGKMDVEEGLNQATEAYIEARELRDLDS